MTKKRLEELHQKFIDEKGTMQDLGEILCEFYLSFSKRTTDIEKNLKDLQETQTLLSEEIETLRTQVLNPVYQLIHSDND